MMPELMTKAMIFVMAVLTPQGTYEQHVAATDECYKVVTIIKSDYAALRAAEVLQRKRGEEVVPRHKLIAIGCAEIKVPIKGMAL